MKILTKAKLGPHKYKTPEGYLVCMDCILGRTGEQEYRRSELFPDTEDDTVIKVVRDKKEVLAPETLASFENKPLTCEHPEEDVTPDNYKTYSVGFVRDVHPGKEGDIDVMLGNIIITDPECINDVENHVRDDLSCGYTCDITDEATPRQINIRGNHVALCSEGRAGIARIVDSANIGISDMVLSRADAMDRCISLGKKFIEHFDKIYIAPENDAQNHWSTEMNAWLKDVKDIKLKNTNKPILNGELRDWFFTAGANPQDFMKDPTDKELEAYDKFVTDILNGKSVAELLKKSFHDAVNPTVKSVYTELNLLPANARLQMARSKNKRTELLGIITRLDQLILRAPEEIKADVRYQAEKILKDLKAQFELSGDNFKLDDAKVASSKLVSILNSEFKKLTGKVKDYHKDVEDYLADIKAVAKDYGEEVDFDVVNISGWSKEPKEYRRDVTLNVRGYDLPFVFTVYLDREAWEPSRYDVHFIKEIHDSEDFIRKDRFTDFENLLTELNNLPLDEKLYPIYFRKIAKKFAEDNKPIGFVYVSSGMNADGIKYRLYKVTGFDKAAAVKIFNDGKEIQSQLNFGEVNSVEDCVHKGFPILQSDDKYLVEFEGVHHEFDDCDSAKAFIDSDIVEKARAMLRDKKIRTGEYSDYFKKELEDLLEKKEQEVEETPNIKNPQTKEAFKETKKNLLQNLREQIAKLNEK